MSLVADYSDSSSSTDSEGSDNKHNKATIVIETSEDGKNRLPSAAGLLRANASSKKPGEVFSNPYLEAENAKTALLEKHVKMVGQDDHLTEKNGRKICWNYRKGRCRFGSNCHYAHDSDLNIPADEAAKQKTAVPLVITKQATTSNQIFTAKTDEEQWQQQHQQQPLGQRKRPGLSQTLVPGKRIMKVYLQQAQTKRKS